MHLSKRVSTAALFALWIVLSMFYYNIFNLLSSVNTRSVKEQNSDYIILSDNHRAKNNKEHEVEDINTVINSDTYEYTESQTNSEVYQSSENDRYISGNYMEINNEIEKFNENNENGQEKDKIIEQNNNDQFKINVTNNNYKDNVTTINMSLKKPTIKWKSNLINTPGCTIPDYGKTIVFKEPAGVKRKCGIRAVFVHKTKENEIIFTIDNKKINKLRRTEETYQCCYTFVSRPTSGRRFDKDFKIQYSPCLIFQNGTRTQLEQEVIAVTCTDGPTQKGKKIYEDVYTLIKKLKKDNIKNRKKSSWNVLILGMDTMSRARAYATMPQTMSHFQKNGWLDFRGYQKVGFNTFPNLVALLTGKTNIYNACKPSMDHCNDHFIWSQYRNASYATAYGEDYLNLPDTFKNYGGFEVPPTDHYMRPFFLTGERIVGNLICAKKLPSAIHILTYARHLAQTYEDNNFFGVFWINSYSHNLFNRPASFDQHTRYFFENIPNSTLSNTFIIVLSDHGIRYGDTRLAVESYYEERLPMFFMWVPYEFRKLYYIEYSNLKQNQDRLTTPYDLHATLWDILKLSRDNVTVIKPEACPNCTSLFVEKSVHRTCLDAGVDQKWCSCHALEAVDLMSEEGEHVTHTALSGLQNITMGIKTLECMRCSAVRPHKVVRIHSHYDRLNQKTFFVIAFIVGPGDVGYEATIEKSSTGYSVVDPITTISAYNKRGSCVVHTLRDRPYCVCEKIPKCHKKPKR